MPVPRGPLVADAAIALLVTAISLGLLSAGGDPGGDVTAAGVLLTCVASLPLVARRRAPLAVFALTGLAGAALRLVAEPVGPPLGPAVALYTIAAGELRRSRAAVPVVATVSVVYAAATAAAAEASRELALAALIWGGAWIAGAGARIRVERIAELEERARRAERDAERERRLAVAEERTRIARDLHDSAGHAINVILVHAGWGASGPSGPCDGARAAFETIEEVARETVGEIDQFVRALREDGDGVEPPPGVAALDGRSPSATATRGLDVTTTVRGARRPLPPAVDQGRLPHPPGGAHERRPPWQRERADLHLAFADEALELTVANPVGRDRSARGDGHGLTGMRERAALLGGSLEAARRDGRFQVRAQLPLGAWPLTQPGPSAS